MQVFDSFEIAHIDSRDGMGYNFCWERLPIAWAGTSCILAYNSYNISVLTDTLMWSKLETSGQLLPPRGGHTTVALGKNLFVFGGFTDESSLYDDIYMLDVGM